MTDILLLAILIIMLLQLHSREKNIGWYGRLYVLIKKRVIRRIRRKAIDKTKSGVYHMIGLWRRLRRR